MRGIRIRTAAGYLADLERLEDASWPVYNALAAGKKPTKRQVKELGDAFRKAGWTIPKTPRERNVRA